MENQPYLIYQWRAFYFDGTLIDQKWNQPDEVKFEALDQSKIMEFIFLNESHLPEFSVNLPQRKFFMRGIVLSVSLPEGTPQLIYFRRIQQKTDGTSSVAYCLGLQVGEAKRVLFINPDGSLDLKESTE